VSPKSLSRSSTSAGKEEENTKTLKPINGVPIQQQPPLKFDVGTPEIMELFETLFRNDIKFRILSVLSNREGACLREIARNVGISHKNLVKYLDTLSQKGIIEVYPVGIRYKVYRLSPKYDFVRQVLK